MSDAQQRFVESLRNSGLLKTAQLQEVTADLAARLGEPRALARELIQRGWLTPYQVNQLMQKGGQGLRLGQYHLLERLGEGGMGQVFKAMHQSLHRIVALKVIRKDRLASPDVIQRFRREMRAAGQLAHPNVVLAFDADEIEGTHYFVMEYVEGIDLAKLVRKSGPLSIADACQYMHQASLGLQHAHERGLVHRDIKPHNLLLSKDGVVKILDMGLARVTELSEDSNAGTLTQDGKVMGTPDFMSPEQSRNSRTADIRADLYSLGCTLYFLLTGSVPFPGGASLTEKLLKHQLDEPTPVEELRPDVPMEIREILHKLLAKQPEDRFQTPAALAAELAPFASGKPGTLASTPPSGAFTPMRTAAASLGRLDSGSWANTIQLFEKFRGSPYKRLLLWSGGALVLLLLLLVLWPRSSDGPSSEALDALAASTVPEGERFTWQPAELVAVLGEHQGRNWDMCRSVAFSPDGKLVASAGADQVVHFWDTRTLREKATLGWIGAPLSSVAYSPDGRYLVTGDRRDGMVYTWQVGGKKPLATIKIKGVLGADPIFAPDSQTVLAAHTDSVRHVSTLMAYQATTGKPRPALPHSTMNASARCLAAASKSSIVAAAFHRGKDSNIAFWDFDQRRELPGVVLPGAVVNIALAPDGGKLACTGVGGQITLVDVATRKTQVIQKPWNQLGFSVAFAPDGRLLAAGFRGRVKIYDVAKGKEKLAFQTFYGDVFSVAFSPDGRSIATGGDDQTVRLWDVTSGVERVPVRGPTIALGFVAFTQDQKGIVAGVAERGEGDRIVETLRWWQLPEGRERASYENPRGQRLPGAFALADDTVIMLSAEKLDEMRYSPVLTRWNLESNERKRLPLKQTDASFTGMAVRESLAATIAVSERQISLWNAETGASLGKLGANDQGYRAVAIAPDATTIAAGGWGPRIELWDVAAAKLIGAVTTENTEGMAKLVFAPDGRKVAALDYNGTWHLWDLDRERITLSSEKHLGVGSSLQFAPDGKTLAAGDQDGRIELWSLETGKLTGETWQLPGAVRGLAFSADGRFLAVINGNATVYVLRRSQ